MGSDTHIGQVDPINTLDKQRSVSFSLTMVYRIIVLAPRKAGVTHEDFKARYEQHMHLVEDICGLDLMPLRHTRSYIRHDGPNDEPVLLAGRVQTYGTTQSSI